MAKENNRSSYFGDVVKKFLAHRLAMMGTIVFHGLHGIWRCSFS